MPTTHIAGEVRLQWTMEAPHPQVDTETVEQAILDCLNAQFHVKPRDMGPVFSVRTEICDYDITIDEDDREDPPKEFDAKLPWYVES